MNDTFVEVVATGDKVIKFCNDYTISSFRQNHETKLLKTAFLNKSGRVISTVLANVIDNNTVIFVVPAENLDSLLEHLKIYAKFSRVLLEARSLTTEYAPYFEIEHILNAPMPWLNKKSEGMYTPSDLSLDVLGWIDFDKGCYLGQEVVSRMFFKVKSKKRFLARVPSASKHINILPETIIHKDDYLSVISPHDNNPEAVHQIWEPSQ